MAAAASQPDAQQAPSPSLWWDGLERNSTSPPLETDTSADIAIVGGGYTGLWTAYFLKQVQPELDVVLVEAKHTGHGASGRNGGWLMGALEGCDAFTDDSGTLPSAAREQLTRLVARGRGPCQRKYRLRFSPRRVCHGCARHDVQIGRAKKILEGFQRLGFSEDDYHWLTPSELTERAGANPGGACYAACSADTASC